MAVSISRKLISDEAKRRGWQVEVFGGNYFYKITDQNGKSEIFRGTRPMLSSANGSRISVRKDLTMDFVQLIGYKVPNYITVTSLNAEAESFLANHETIVAKPIDSEQSLGVTTEIKTTDQLDKAINDALVYSRAGRIILQKQLYGNLYRLFVVNGKLVAVALRKAAEVVGDDQHTVRQLIEKLNEDPRRGESSDTPLKKIKISESEEYLGSDGLDSIPYGGVAVRVSAIDSVSAGGESTDVTALTHEDWASLAGDIASQAGLFVCGVDVICADISQPIHDKELPLLEINSAPGLKLHHFPTGGGDAIDVASIILDEAFSIAKTS